jgi:hypothetical protein
LVNEVASVPNTDLRRHCAVDPDERVERLFGFLQKLCELSVVKRATDVQAVVIPRLVPFQLSCHRRVKPAGQAGDENVGEGGPAHI